MGGSPAYFCNLPNLPFGLPLRPNPFHLSWYFFTSLRYIYPFNILLNISGVGVGGGGGVGGGWWGIPRSAPRNI